MGTAMGTPGAVKYAVLFMDHVEKKILHEIMMHQTFGTEEVYRQRLFSLARARIPKDFKPFKTTSTHQTVPSSSPLNTQTNSYRFLSWFIWKTTT